MKTNSLSLKCLLISCCFISYFITGCSKAGTDNIVDPGYGCSTNTVLQTVTNSPAKLVYLAGAAQWAINLDLPGGIYIICETCGNDAAISAITAGHASGDIIDITVSGRIKRISAGQPALYSHAGYRDIYLLSVDGIVQ